MEKNRSSFDLSRYVKQRITRRQAIKAGGIAAIGLVFSKPVIETIRPKSAFANYVVRDIDNTPPTHTVQGSYIGIRPGTSARVAELEIAVLDGQSGLCTIIVDGASTSLGVQVDIPSFTPGTTDPVIVEIYETILDTVPTGQATIICTDCAGNQVTTTFVLGNFFSGGGG